MTLKMGKTCLNASILIIILFLSFTMFLSLHRDNYSVIWTNISLLHQTAINNSKNPTIKHEKWIVVTTISQPTNDIQKLASIEGWKLLVVGDSKTPRNWSYPGSIFLGVEEQQRLGYRIIEHLPLNSYTRKNIGYLYAIQHGARFIYDTDDDNHPTDNLTKFKTTTYRTGIIHDVEDSIVTNPYAHFGQPTIWPRGFPLDLAGEPLKNTYVSCRFRTPSVQQGLVNGDPDVDAIFRLTRKKLGTDLNVTFDSRAPSIVLPPGVFSPYNSQNTFHSYQALWSLLLPTTVAFRVTDIWRGYWAQRLLWLTGQVMSFHPPNAFQKRNAHSYLKDFVDEEEVYEDSGKFIRFLSNWNCQFLHTFFQCMSQLSQDMALEGFWRNEDAELTDAWIADLIQIGYKEPLVVNYIARNSSAVCLTSYPPRRVLFFPVMQDTPFLNQPSTLPQRYQITPTFNIISSLCSLNNSIGKPSYDFSNLLLVIVFNFPHLQVVQMLDEMYFNHFPNILYCADVNSSDWSSLHLFNINNPESLSRRLSFLNSTNNSGYYGYECALQAIEMGYEVDGYMVIGDDVLLNFWNLKSYFDITKVHIVGVDYATRSRYSNDTSWIWWPNEFLGKAAVNRFLDDVVDIAKSDNRTEDEYLDRGTAIKSFYQNNYRRGLNMTNVTITSSDIYYIPRVGADIFYHVGTLLRKNNVFLEIAVPTALDSLLPTVWASMPGIGLWTGDRTTAPLNYYNSTHTFLHPVKIGILKQNANFTADFCHKYISEFLSNW